MPGFEQTTPYLKALPTRLLAIAGVRGSSISRAALAEHGSGQFEFSVMVTLAEYGAVSQAELCRRTGLDRKDVATVVLTLEQAGHVARTADAGDARRKIVSLTAEGQSRFARLRQVADDSQDRALAMLSESERATLVALLQKILAAD
ncbi:MarR family winged helix-turn-helix transcriptional regulator [Pararhodobacter marinus]|uniref:MarR family winged helix-turn-helix transcriptional regulator n=1 Tax=Pararhodobacter marinus TaxID=2184063 RepID=UPI00351771D2